MIVQERDGHLRKLTRRRWRLIRWIVRWLARLERACRSP